MLGKEIKAEIRDTNFLFWESQSLSPHMYSIFIHKQTYAHTHACAHTYVCTHNFYKATSNVLKFSWEMKQQEDFPNTSHVPWPDVFTGVMSVLCIKSLCLGYIFLGNWNNGGFQLIIQDLCIFKVFAQHWFWWKESKFLPL